MSYVTNVLLKTSILESVDSLNRSWLENEAYWSRPRPLKGVTSASLPQLWYGGTRALECEFYPAAFNLLNLDELVKVIQSCNWQYPEAVQLFVQEQESTRLVEVPLNLDDDTT